MSATKQPYELIHIQGLTLNTQKSLSRSLFVMVRLLLFCFVVVVVVFNAEKLRFQFCTMWTVDRRPHWTAPEILSTQANWSDSSLQPTSYPPRSACLYVTHHPGLCCGGVSSKKLLLLGLNDLIPFMISQLVLENLAQHSQCPRWDRKQSCKNSRRLEWFSMKSRAGLWLPLGNLP